MHQPQIQSASNRNNTSQASERQPQIQQVDQDNIGQIPKHRPQTNPARSKHSLKYRIVAPIFNEEKYIRKFLEDFPKKHLSSLILVDDGSTDNTKEIIKRLSPNITLLRHKINLGKGCSLETGALQAIKDKADIIIFMDGDLQHNPTDIDRFLRKFKKDKKLDIVFGARAMGKNMKLMPFLGNKILTVTTNLLFKYFLNDTQCGFRAFHSRVFDKIRWTTPDYAAETEMIIKAARHHLRYKEINIDTVYIDQYKGTYLVDGISILFKTIMWKIFK